MQFDNSFEALFNPGAANNFFEIAGLTDFEPNSSAALLVWEDTWATELAEAVRGAVTERTLWLIGHHMDLLIARERGLSARLRRELEASEYLEDLRLLRELDDAGRVPGAMVGTVDEALDYLKELERSNG